MLNFFINNFPVVDFFSLQNLTVIDTIFSFKSYFFSALKLLLSAVLVALVNILDVSSNKQYPHGLQILIPIK